MDYSRLSLFMVIVILGTTAVCLIIYSVEVGLISRKRGGK